MRSFHQTENKSTPKADAGFELFYAREHAPQVRRAALLVGSDELANDLVHDAFIEVYRRWDQLDNPGGYLNRAVLNACRDEGRARPVRLRALRLIDSSVVEPTDHVMDVLLGLPFNQRAAKLVLSDRNPDDTERNLSAHLQQTAARTSIRSDLDGVVGGHRMNRRSRLGRSGRRRPADGIAGATGARLAFAAVLAFVVGGGWYALARSAEIGDNARCRLGPRPG